VPVAWPRARDGSEAVDVTVHPAIIHVRRVSGETHRHRRERQSGSDFRDRGS
jgi:hypothetical protein